MGERRGDEDGGDEAGEFGGLLCQRKREARTRLGAHGSGPPVWGREPLHVAQQKVKA